MKISKFIFFCSFFILFSCSYDNVLDESLDEHQINNSDNILSRSSATKVFRTDDPITIDGQDQEWSEVPKRKIREEVDLGLPIENKSDLSGYYKMLWDDDNLYIYCHILDEDIDVSGAQPFEKDGIEIYIDGDNSKNVAQSIPPPYPPSAYDANDDFIRFIVDEPNPISNWGFIDVSNFEFQIAITSNGYDVEIQIPFSDWPDFQGEEGHTFGLEVQVNDNDNGQRQNFIKWKSGLDASWYDPSIFGTAVLFGHTAG